MGVFIESKQSEYNQSPIKVESFESLLLCVIYNYKNAIYEGIKIPNRLANNISELNKYFRVRGYRFALSARYMLHFYDRHVMSAEKGLYPLCFEDIRGLNSIIRNYDKIALGNKPNRIVLTKITQQGNYHVVLEIQPKHKYLAGVSFRMDAKLTQ